MKDEDKEKEETANMLLVNAQGSMEVAEHLLKSLEKTKRRTHTMEL